MLAAPGLIANLPLVQERPLIYYRKMFLLNNLCTTAFLTMLLTFFPVCSGCALSKRLVVPAIGPNSSVAPSKHGSVDNCKEIDLNISSLLAELAEQNRKCTKGDPKCSHPKLRSRLPEIPGFIPANDQTARFRDNAGGKNVFDD